MAQKYTLNSPAVTTHLTIVAEIINRLATNSNYCKTICVAIVTVFATFTTSPNWTAFVIWLIPIVAICLLDSLFVFMKKKLTKEQEIFVKYYKVKREAGEEKVDNKLIEVAPFVLNSSTACEKICGTLKNLGDVSIWLFYGAMIATLLLHIVINQPSICNCQ